MEQTANMDGKPQVETISVGPAGTDNTNTQEVQKQSKGLQPYGENARQPEQPAQTPEVLTQTEVKIKKPIFVGTAEPEIVDVIAKLLFEDKLATDVHTGEQHAILQEPEYDLFIIQPDIFQKLHEQYLFKLLGEEQRNKEAVMAKAEQYKEGALLNALQIEHMVTEYRFKKNIILDNPLVFTEPELKTIMDYNSKKFNHQQLWTLLDFLMVQQYIYPHNIEANELLIKSKKKWELVIDNERRLKNLKRELGDARIAINKWEVEHNTIGIRVAQLELEVIKERQQKLADATNRGNGANADTNVGAGKTE